MFYWIIRAIVCPVVRTLFWFRTVGRENIPKEGKLILCCNHMRFVDVVMLVLGCPRKISFMAKEELFRNPILGWAFRRMGAFPVKKAAGGRGALDHAVKLVEDGGMLGIFPEGKRCHEGHPTRAKAGIAMILSQVDAPVIPAAVEYYDERKVFTRGRVIFGKPIDHSRFEMKDNSREELRRVSDLVMDAVTAEWEKIRA